MSKHKRSWLRKVRRFFAMAYFWLWWSCIGARFWKSPVIFAVYGASPNDFTAYGGRKFIDRIGSIWPVFPLQSRKVAGKRLALTVAVPHTMSEMEENPDLLRDAFRRIDIERISRRATTVALAGRLPGVAHSLGVPLPDGFCSGVMGTCYTCIATVEQYIASKSHLNQSELTVAVVGVGFTGRRLIMHMLSRNGFKQFIGIDKVNREGYFLTPEENTEDQLVPIDEMRHYLQDRKVPVDDDPIAESKLIITTDPTKLSKADIVIVLTGEGADMRELVQHLKPGAIVFDDTHPQMPEDVIEAINERTDNLFKMAMTITDLDSWPPLPQFSRKDLEGCMVEAVVVARNGGLGVTDMEEFDRLARKAGLHPRYPRHLLR